MNRTVLRGVIHGQSTTWLTRPSWPVGKALAPVRDDLVAQGVESERRGQP
jgi:hypothetical protein